MRPGILLIFLFVIAGCQKSKVPKDLLSPEKMQAVYWDYLRADVFVNEFVRKDSTLKPDIESARLQNEVFQLHKTSRSQFYDSYQYYLKHPELMKAVLDTMIKRKQEEPKKPDTGRNRIQFRNKRLDTLNKAL